MLIKYITRVGSEGTKMDFDFIEFTYNTYLYY